VLEKLMIQAQVWLLDNQYLLTREFDQAFTQTLQPKPTWMLF